MATVYFTNNSDSGDGSLRAAIESASAGDTIAPDPNVAWNGDIEIALSSALSSKSIVLTGSASRRIILNAQGATRFYNVSTSLNMTFQHVDFKGGARNDAAPIYISKINSGDAWSFDSCRFYGGSGNYSGAIQLATANTAGTVEFINCVAFNNSATATYGASVVYVAAASLASVSITGCTFGRGAKPAKGGSGGSVVVSNSLLDGENAVDFASAGFADATNYDFRLTASSPYLTGGATTGVDFLGHARSGSVGAFDGSWLVVAASGSTTLASNTTVDYLEVGAGATVTFSGENRILAAKKGATIGAASFVAAADSTGYLATPTGTSTSSATLTGVKTATYGANVTAFSATCVEGTVSFSIAKTNAVAVLLEKQSGSTWTTVSTDATNSTTDSIAATTVYRTFDGATFKTATATVDGWVPPEHFWRITPFAVLGGEPGTEEAAFSVKSWSVDPETYDD